MQIEHRIRTEIQGEKSYQADKEQLAKYLKLEDVTQGYYVVFDYRQTRTAGKNGTDCWNDDSELREGVS